MDILTLYGLVFICFGHIAGAKTEDVYFVIGKSLELRPPSGVADALTSVQWRHKDNIAAEWSTDFGVETYRNFKDRADLNTTNGYLLIRDMTEAEAGGYSVAINNNRLDVLYVAQSIMEVPKPTIWVKPGKDEAERVLDCQGEVKNAGPVTFWWNLNGSWVESDRKTPIVDDEATRSRETFSCKMVNPVGAKESEPVPNPFNAKAGAGGNPALGALAIIPIALVVILVGVGIWQKDKIMTFMGKGGSAPVSPTTAPNAEGNETAVPLRENSG